MKKLLTIVAALACLTLTGCMTYSHNSLPEVGQWPLDSYGERGARRRSWAIRP